MSTDVWEVAKEMEQEGKAFYEELSRATPVKQLRGTFAKLAIEEQKHYDLFDRLSRQLEVEPLADPGTLGEAKTVFAALRGAFDVPAVLEDAVSSYAKALDMEQNAVAYYTSALAGAQTDGQKQALETIIEEERKHVRLMEVIGDFVRRPKEWLEDAEFTHLDEY